MPLVELYSERSSEDWHAEKRSAQHALVLVLHVGSDRKKAALKAHGTKV